MMNLAMLSVHNLDVSVEGVDNCPNLCLSSRSRARAPGRVAANSLPFPHGRMQI
jgi:hypothetical protein